jgi:sulfoxide reductase heme-binding subunit YedZ
MPVEASLAKITRISSGLLVLSGRMFRFLDHHFRFLSHGIGILPLGFLAWDAFSNNLNLTINPIQYLTLRTGKAALIMVVITLMCTPLNRLFGIKAALKARRTFGLYAFLYASIHVLIFLGLDYLFNLQLIWKDLSDKRYILAGAGSFLILLPLALTSFQWWMKRLGKNWKKLHRMIYLAALLSAVHYVWLVKTDIRVPLIYTVLILLLLALRVKAIREAIANLPFSRSVRKL